MERFDTANTDNSWTNAGTFSSEVGRRPFQQLMKEAYDRAQVNGKLRGHVEVRNPPAE